MTNQDNFPRKIEQNTKDISDLKVENAELKNKISVLDEKLIRLVLLLSASLSAQWCSCTLAASYAGGTEFKSRSHHKRYSLARVA